MSLPAATICDLLDLRVPVAEGGEDPSSPRVIEAMREFSRQIPREIIYGGLGGHGQIALRRSPDGPGYEVLWLPQVTHLVLEGGHCDGMLIHEDHELFPDSIVLDPRAGFSMTFQQGDSRMATAWQLSGWSTEDHCFTYHQVAPSIHDVAGDPVYSA